MRLIAPDRRDVDTPAVARGEGRHAALTRVSAMCPVEDRRARTFRLSLRPAPDEKQAMRYIVYPLVAPLAFAAAFSMYHWQKLTLELAGWNLLGAYVLFFLPSLLVACVDTRGMKHKGHERLPLCVVTMMMATVVPFVVLIPGAMEGYFLLALAGAALAAAIACYWISDVLEPAGKAP